MKNITVTLEYQLTDEFVKQEAARLGKCPEASQKYEFLLEAVLEDMRKQIIAAGQFDVYNAKITLRSPVYGQFKLPYLVNDDNRQEATAKYLAFIEAYRQKQAEKEREEEKRRAERQAEAKAREEAEKAAREAEEKEKRDWINQHGSERLKKAAALGYTCEKLYVKERAALEFPDFTVDLEEAANWESRICPSMKALEIEEQVQQSEYFKPDLEVYAVKLTHPPYEIGDYDYQDWQPREAVVIRKYLGRYDLVKEI